jgi:transcriptional regulator with XRE-family HTH domain
MAEESLQVSVARAFGEVLRDHRKHAQLSQEKLAEASELDRTYISFLERGVRQPSLVTLIKLGRALGVPVSDLVSEVQERVGHLQQ